MPLSKNFIDKNEADNLAIDYKPRSIEAGVSLLAKNFSQKGSDGDFKVDKVLAEYVGIDQIEKEAQQKEVARQAIKLSREIQEKAYAEAYALGLKQGQEIAYEEEKHNIARRIDLIKGFTGQLRQIKSLMSQKNEEELVQLCFYMAQRLLFKEVNENKEYTKELLAKLVESMQNDQNMIIRLSSQDHEWFEAHRSEFFKDLRLEEDQVKIESDPSISPGGVIIETDYGEVDATIEQRIQKLDAILKSKA
jgi:flagellar assembly protein FliH